MCSERASGNDGEPCWPSSAEPRLSDCSFQPGDLILFRTEQRWTLILYRVFLADSITHAGIVVRHPDGSLAILEAPGVRYPVMLSEIDSRLTFYKGQAWVRHLHHPLTKAQSQRLTKFALAQQDKQFAVATILLPPWGKPVRKWGRRCAGPHALNSRRWFCSALCIGAGVAAGLLDPCNVRPLFTDPEDLFSDRYLDLSPIWKKPVSIQPLGTRLSGWWSRAGTGERSFWE